MRQGALGPSNTNDPAHFSLFVLSVCLRDRGSWGLSMAPTAATSCPWGTILHICSILSLSSRPEEPIWLAGLSCAFTRESWLTMILSLQPRVEARLSKRTREVWTLRGGGPEVHYGGEGQGRGQPANLPPGPVAGILLFTHLIRFSTQPREVGVISPISLELKLELTEFAFRCYSHMEWN